MRVASYILFEEDGGFKAGGVLVDNETTLQVEMPSGKRGKIKSAQILLRFTSPAPGQLLETAKPLADEMDAAFLWEVAGDAEFHFLDFARDYYGDTPDATQATALLLALHSAPVYFHRKGKGRFRKAPADILRAALAALEKKREQALVVERWVDSLTAGNLPSELKPHAGSLLGKPDRNKPEIKAFEMAAARLSVTAPELLLRVGALKSAYEIHYRVFLQDQFPKGTAFPSVQIPALPVDLPEAQVHAFSIDDANTTEVDDALSVTPLPGGGWRVGIHIAAPGLAITHGSPLDAIARARLSTVYMPGHKLTMLPDPVVAAYTLEGGEKRPALSLYFTVSETLAITGRESRAEWVHIAANLRHHEIEPWFNAGTVEGVLPDKPFRDELLLLWRFANVCEARRGKPSSTQGFYDYDFAIDGDLSDPEACRVTIRPRQRGSPLDKLVAELMILANTTWGGLLAEKGIACLYRAQVDGKTRMSTTPQPHEGLGVPQYAWMTSPLRRYCDLVNQWQLAACLAGKPPPFAPRASELFAAMRDFETTYTAYAEFQHRMERYWCLRWLRQETRTQVTATVRRDDLVKFDGLPFFARIPGLPALPSGQTIRLAIDALDFLALEARCRLLEVLPAETAKAAEGRT
ncbi:MAG: RNB domain-containing ribonuclease [Zoogloeaceae bacterium]|jgi:exoribonuclease-2|nr:RNB domain-containing ribonuclease [Zoogloeaceae bacterium]